MIPQSQNTIFSKKIDEIQKTLIEILSILQKKKITSEFLSVKETSELLKKSEVTIRRLIKDNFLKAVKIGKGGRTNHYRIYKKSVDELIRKSKGGL